ncbi:hypothetical protein DL96DRAFT_713189 [Flagelloscypha sp. PMI_526]|nr:hypothetical protein DL96DRAFT_713189 [Flagelloscypha sp. PMI_526]
MSLPLFQNLTHLEIIRPQIIPWERTALHRLPHLTHLYVDIKLTSDSLRSIVDGLIPSLPTSIQIVILDYHYNKPSDSELDVYDGLRIGQVDSRVLLSSVLDNEWIYHTDGINIDEWALSGMGGEEWWQLGMKVLKQRNHALGLKNAKAFSLPS